MHIDRYDDDRNLLLPLFAFQASRLTSPFGTLRMSPSRQNRSFHAGHSAH